MAAIEQNVRDCNPDAFLILSGPNQAKQACTVRTRISDVLLAQVHPAHHDHNSRMTETVTVAVTVSRASSAGLTRPDPVSTRKQLDPYGAFSVTATQAGLGWAGWLMRRDPWASV